MKQHLRGASIDMVLPVGYAQYSVELPLLRGLETHPLRTYDLERAALHVVAAAPLASYLVGLYIEHNISAHVDRMSRLADALRSNTHLRQGRPFLFIFGHPSFDKILGLPLVRALGKRNVILATTDPTFSRIVSQSFSFSPAFKRVVERGIAVPLLAHSLAHETSAHAVLERRRAGFMFHGGLGRFDFGLRNKTIAIMGAVRQKGIPVDIQIGEMTRGNQNGLASSFNNARYARSASSFLRASLCMVPSGDVVTSRRLFDALEAGCVPVLVRSWFAMNLYKTVCSDPLCSPGASASRSVKLGDHFYTSLPFPSSIDWASMTIRLVPSRTCNKRQTLGHTSDAQWLSKWHHTGSALEDLRWRGRRAFHDHMDYEYNPSGVANALLRDLHHKIS